MVSSLSTALLLGLFCSTALAQTTSCTTRNAIPLESLLQQNSGSSGGGGGSSSGGSSSGGSVLEYNNFLNGLQQQRNDLTRAGGELFKNAAGAKLRKRDMECDGTTEACLSLENDPFCINPNTYDFRTTDGKGNLETGDYILNTGVKGNLYNPVASTSATPTANGGSGAAATSPSTNAASTSAGSQGRTSSVTAGSATSSTSPPRQSQSASGATTKQMGSVFMMAPVVLGWLL